MALTVKDRVKEVFTTTGTANFVLGGASSGYQTFGVIGDGNTTFYAAVDPTTGDWEVGVGTYSSTGPTLTRDTVLESSNAGSKVSFAAGSKDIFCTYPAERAVYLDAAGSAVTTLDIGTLGTSTANITTANITAGTVSTTPASANDLVNKSYVDTIVASGITYHVPVKYEVPDSAGSLNATYNNGTAGVGATLTNAGTLGAFTPDGVVAQVGDRVLIYGQTNAYENGVYTVTTVGDGSTPWVLTRASDADSYALKDPNALGEGDAFFITSGNTAAGETYVCNTQGTIVFGTTAITFAQVSAAQVYSAGNGITLTNTVFSLTPVGTAGTYGSASQVPVLTTNSTGQVTGVTNTSIAITSGQVSGLAASATTDTTDATNITSGTLNSARLSGSYTGVTGVGTLTAGTWNATPVTAAYGGTGLTSFVAGDLIYADSATTLARLADVAAGNALLSGGVGGNPSWGKVGLQTHVDGVLQVSNGGTGAGTLTGYVYGNGTGAFTASTSIPNSATTATSANTASAIVARDASGNFSAGTITASLSGNATTASTANATTAAVTFNNGGSGGASGSTFNGSGALTVSYNTVGAPSTTGTNASGTWGISITGSAGSATNATNATNASNLTGGNISGLMTGTMAAGSQVLELANNDNYVSARVIRNNASTSNRDGMYIGYGNTNSGVTRIFGGGATSGGIEVTGSGVNNVTIAGNVALNAGNYNSYSPTLTGSGASGTWGINITGNAATASNSSQLNGISSTQLFNNMGQNHGTQTDFNAISDFGVRYVQGTTNGPGTGSQYYGFTIGLGNDYAYSSYASQLYWPRTPLSGSPYLSVRFREDGSWGSWSKIYAGYADTAGNATTVGGLGTGSFLRKDITNTMFEGQTSALAFENQSTFFRFAFNELRFYDWNNGQDILTLNGDVSTPNYFVGKWDSSGRNYSREWIEFPNHSGLYSPLNSAHFYPNNLTYGSWRVAGSRNGWHGLHFDSGSTLMMNSSEVGFHREGVGWQMRWNSGTGYISKGSSGGGTEAVILDASNFTNYVQVTYAGWPGSPGTDANGFYGGSWARSSFTYSNNAPYTGPIAFFPAGGYDLQFNSQYSGHGFAVRARNGDSSSWMAWKIVLTDYNYNSYSPTLTGGGASGTWGISITGNAGNGITYTSGFPPYYGARAWVCFSGQGAVSVRASRNVLNITDLGVGSYRINFNTSMPDTNYVVSGSAEWGSAGWYWSVYMRSKLTDSFNITVGDTANVYDSSNVMVVVHR